MKVFFEGNSSGSENNIAFWLFIFASNLQILV